MNCKERVIRALEFRNPDRTPICTMHLPTKKLTDFFKILLTIKTDMFMTSYVYKRKKLDKTTAVDVWGAVWKSLGNKGEVVDGPLKEWSGLDSLKVPDDYLKPASLLFVKATRFVFGKKFLIGDIPDMPFSRCSFLRGFTRFMEDLCFYPDEIKRLVDIITELNLKLIDTYADLGLDGVIGCDDLGLQDSLMISPQMFRDIFKPSYAKMIQRAHERGMKFFLHSCGQIKDIIEDFIEIGLDALQCDQQDNMGVDELNKKFGGRIAFFSPVDIQTTLSTNDKEKIYQKSRKLVATLGSHGGGFLGKVYPTPKDIGTYEDSIYTMLKAFIEK
ncbi:MAG: uroporphyrinogen decarboxylase family protein [Christensenellales bacterium]|jgi:uroporphyrinogen decarboxylase